MANVNKIIGSLATAINKVSGSAISGLAKIIGATIALFSNTKSLSHGIVDGTDYATAESTGEEFQVDQADAWSISFWIKVGWTSSLNTSTHLIASSEAGSTSAQDNQWRVYYNESNNRLYIGWRSASTQRSNNFWYFHHTGAGEAAAQTGLGATYWSSSNTGYVNENDFTLITLTKGTTITATAANVTAYWNGQNIGDAYYASGNNNGTPALNDSVARTFAIGNKSWSNGNNMNGEACLYDEVALWNKELSAAEVLEIWGGAGDLGETTGAPSNLQKSSMVENLIGWWRFETDGTVSTVGSATLTLGGDVSSVTDPA